MTETGVIALAGVAATLISALGVAWLTNRSTRQRDIEARRSLAKDEIRGTLVELVVTARKWGGSTVGLAGQLALVTQADQFHRKLDELMSNSAYGKDFNSYGPQLIEIATKARMQVADGSLGDSIARVQMLRAEWWERIVEPMTNDLGSGISSFDERLKIVDRYVRDVGDAITQLETAARDELADFPGKRRALIRETRNDRT